mmetsp:Transcript_18558/g.42370  ORF Transcript_18558/g.42370 Transcript_18558/m.42370 type:complete len:257 (+) Transcript_18558:428-1198(+)
MPASAILQGATRVRRNAVRRASDPGQDLAPLPSSPQRLRVQWRARRSLAVRAMARTDGMGVPGGVRRGIHPHEKPFLQDHRGHRPECQDWRGPRQVLQPLSLQVRAGETHGGGGGRREGQEGRRSPLASDRHGERRRGGAVVPGAEEGVQDPTRHGEVGGGRISRVGGDEEGGRLGARGGAASRVLRLGLSQAAQRVVAQARPGRTHWILRDEKARGRRKSEYDQECLRASKHGRVSFRAGSVQEEPRQRGNLRRM